jgi:hypothetical protein
VAVGTRKETLSQLVPEWEQAVEPDLTRAITRLLNAAPPGGAPAAPPASAAVVADVKSIIPDIASTSLEDGRKQLQAVALKDFAEAAGEMDTQLKDAQQRLTQAQAGGSEADQQAAMKNLQDVQAKQSAKLREIAARARAQIAAFEQLKKSNP